MASCPRPTVGVVAPKWVPFLLACFGMWDITSSTLLRLALVAPAAMPFRAGVAWMDANVNDPVLGTIFGLHLVTSVLMWITILAWGAHVVEAGMAVAALGRTSALVSQSTRVFYVVAVFVGGFTYLGPLKKEIRRAERPAADAPFRR